MAPATPDVATALLDHCTRIEAVLRDRYRLTGRHGLREVVREAISLGDPTTSYYAEQLFALAELQDVVLRSRDGRGTPVAPPLPETLARAERVRQEIEYPTLAIRFASGALSRATSGEALGPRLVEMRRQDFSQVPVYDAGVFAGLLTTNAVARWLADQLDERGDALIDGARVRDVLPYLEPHEIARFVPQGAPANAVVAVLLGERPPLAVIITATGRASEPPLGLVVAADLPALLERLAV